MPQNPCRALAGRRPKQGQAALDRQVYDVSGVVEKRWAGVTSLRSKVIR